MHGDHLAIWNIFLSLYIYMNIVIPNYSWNTLKFKEKHIPVRINLNLSWIQVGRTEMNPVICGINILMYLFRFFSINNSFLMWKHFIMQTNLSKFLILYYTYLWPIINFNLHILDGYQFHLCIKSCSSVSWKLRHCCFLEYFTVNLNRIEPLLARIKEERTAVLCPIVDAVMANTLDYSLNGGYQVGGFTWSMHFTWRNVPERDKVKRLYTDPVP